MFGKKGATYEKDLSSLNPMEADASRVFLYNKPLTSGASHFDVDRVIDWEKGHPVLFKGKGSGKYEVRKLKEITVSRDTNDFHTSIIIEEGLTSDISSEGGYIVLLHNSGTSWARLADNLPAQTAPQNLTLDRDVDWQKNDKIVVTTTDYLPGHSECIGRAGGHTGRFESIINALWAEGAFVNEGAGDDSLVIVKVWHAKGAGVHTITAANTDIRVVNNRAVFAFVISSNRAGGHAVRVFTVHAVIHHCGPVQVGEFTLDPYTRHPDTGFVHWDAVFDTAGHHTGAAINAAGGIK